MLATVQITFSLFVLIGLGYGCARAGLFKQSDIGTLGKFVVYVSLPALLFKLFVSHDPSEFTEWRFFIVYVGASMTVFAGQFAFWLRRGRHPPVAALWAYGSAASNSGFIGLPLVIQVIGPAAGVAAIFTLMVENLVVVPAFLALATEHRRGSGAVDVVKTIASTLARSPVVIAIVFGFLAMLFGLRLPAVIQTPIDLLAAASPALALFVVGGSLAAFDLRAMTSEAGWIVFAKLVAHPLLVMLLALFIPINSVALYQAAIVLAGVPPAVVFPAFASRIGQGPVAAAALVAATLVSFVTLTVLIWFVHDAVPS